MSVSTFDGLAALVGVGFAEAGALERADGDRTSAGVVPAVGVVVPVGVVPAAGDVAPAGTVALDVEVAEQPISIAEATPRAIARTVLRTPADIGSLLRLPDDCEGRLKAGAPRLSVP